MAGKIFYTPLGYRTILRNERREEREGSMASSSSLISSIGAALNHLNLDGKRRLWDTALGVLQLKIELRNMKVQVLICCRKLGDDLPPCFSGIEGAMKRILLQEVPSDYGLVNDTFKEWIYGDALPVVRGFANQVGDDCYASPLAVEDVVAIADFFLANLTEFWHSVEGYQWLIASGFVKIDAIDAFAAQVAFLKSLLVFAEGTGVELQHLMIGFQPFAIYAMRVFVGGQRGLFNDWCEEIHSKCSAVIGIATAPQVYEAYNQALSASIFSSTPADTLENFLGSLIALLWDVLCRHSNSRVMDQLKLLYERLRLCRSILKRKPGCFDGEIMDQIGVLTCDAGMLVSLLHHTHVEVSYLDRLSELLERFSVLQVENNVSAHVVEDSMFSDGTEETTTLSHQPQRSSSGPEFAGFQDDEVSSVLNRLTRGSKQLQIVAICGMPGLGKTTFASVLYNCRSIIYHFQAHAWVPISQVLDKKNVFLQLLKQLGPESGSNAQMTEDDLANKLRQCLKGKRYLIFLDDVWTTEAWHSLAPSFPDDSTQSRVILTSRHCAVVPDQQPHLLRLRDDNECFEILKKKLSHKKGWDSEVGMTIARMCKGLPLTAVIVAGLLGTTKQGWKGILDHFSSSGVFGDKLLQLSFKHLPNDLKPCFLYFAAFPEGKEISVKRLLQLWIGEGFVRKCEYKRIEDVAREYVENLIQRSLVMVAQNRSIGGVKTCRIHDLIHDFCLRKSKQENFFHILSQKDDELSDFNEPPNLRRLSIHSNPVHFMDSRLFCPRAHSMLFFSTASKDLADMVFIILIFKLLTVLDIGSIYFSSGIPSEIELLTQLRYLSIWSSPSDIPSSLGNLSNLETLIGVLWSRDGIPFPHTFWNLLKLKWLYISMSVFSLPTENLENSCALLELETLCGVVFNSYSSMEQQLRKFPNIRRLKCRILPGAESTAYSNKIVVPDFLNQVQCLTISGKGRLPCEFGSSGNLRRLSLSGFELSREEVSDIGKLPNLEVLKLKGTGFWGDTLDMQEGEFSKLRHLKLADMDIKRWTVSDEHLPCLQKLILYKCKVSEELPSDCLETSATLEEIQVYACSPNVEDFARGIREAQEDFGNSVKVHIKADAVIRDPVSDEPLLLACYLGRFIDFNLKD